MENIQNFVDRLNKIGIKIELVGNYPWVYIDRICGKKVKETFASEHGWVVFIGKSIYIKETYELIRKYLR